jgi:hypothetical protein
MPKAKTIKIVDVEQPQETQPDEQPAEEVTPEVEEVKETPKAKSKARAKKKVIDETITVAKNVVLDFDTKDEPTIKAIEKVECPNCNKMVSAKTFKYSHVHTCKAKKEVVEQPQAMRVPTTDSLETIEVKPVILSSREARLQKRQEHLNSLIKQAF